MRFQQRLHSINCGARPETCNSGEAACKSHLCRAMHAYGKDTRERRPPTFETQIRGGKTQCPSQLVAAHYASPHRVRAAQPPLREVEVAPGQRRPDPAAADPLPIDSHRGDDIHTETQLLARGNEHGRGGLAVAPKPEVMADHDRGRPQVPRKQLREVAAGEITQGFAKAQQPDGIYVHPGEEAPALPPGCEPGRGVVRHQILARHGLEREQHGTPSQARRVAGQAPEKRLVPPVEAVERPNGDDGSAVTFAQVLESANQLHGLFEPPTAKV